MSDSTKQSERSAIAMNDNCLGRISAKEKEWMQVCDKIMAGKGAAKPDAEDLSYADALRHCAADVRGILESLAAAAPAPPDCPVKGISCDAPCKDYPRCAAQDGQGAELLGPPRGGSSSDLADSDGQGMAASEHILSMSAQFSNGLDFTISGAEAQENMRQAMKVLCGETTAKVYLLECRNPDCAQQYDALSKKGADRDFCSVSCYTHYHSDGKDASLDPELDILDDANHQPDCDLRNAGSPRGEKRQSYKCTCKVAPSLPEAVAGNASAPVGEKRQPSEEEIAGIKQGLADVAAGRVKPLEQIKAELAGQPSGVQQSSDSVTARAYEVFGLTMREKLGKREPSMNAWAEQARLVDETYRELMKSLPAGQPSGVGEPQDWRRKALRCTCEAGLGGKHSTGCMLAPEVGEGLREANIRLDEHRKTCIYCTYNHPKGHGHGNSCASGTELLNALAAPAPKPELTSRDCICPTTCDGPEYNLKILPNCPWHSRAPKPAPPAERE